MVVIADELSTDELSTGERRIVALITACPGISNKEIAEVTGMTVHRVKHHRDRIFRTLGVGSATAICELTFDDDGHLVSGWAY